MLCFAQDDNVIGGYLKTFKKMYVLLLLEQEKNKTKQQKT